MSPITAEPGVVQLSLAEGREMLDERTRRLLDLSLDDFEAAYEAGRLDLGDPNVLHLIMLLPFAR